MNKRTATRLRRCAGIWGLVVPGLILAVLVTACGGVKGGASTSGAAASARAEASSSAGQAAKTQASALAAACKPAGGFNALEPGVPGAAAARKTFETCEKIPEDKVFSLGVCLVTAYSRAPARGPSGSAAETARQTDLADADGACVQVAKGLQPAASPPASRVPATFTAVPSASTTS